MILSKSRAPAAPPKPGKPWKKRALAFPILGSLWLLGCAAWAEPAPTGVVARAGQLFGVVEQRFEALETLQYTVERTTHSARQQMQERWQFRYRGRRVLVPDGGVLWAAYVHES